MQTELLKIAYDWCVVFAVLSTVDKLIGKHIQARTLYSMIVLLLLFYYSSGYAEVFVTYSYGNYIPPKSQKAVGEK